MIIHIDFNCKKDHLLSWGFCFSGTLFFHSPSVLKPPIILTVSIRWLAPRGHKYSFWIPLRDFLN